MKDTRWLKLLVGLALGLGLMAVVLLVPGGGLAQPAGAEPRAASQHGALTGPAPPHALGSSEEPPPADVASIVGSAVETENCYQADRVQTFCFTIYNGSVDAEWLDTVTLTFPNYPGLGPWSVTACGPQDATDSLGYAVNLSCAPSVNQVVYTDADSDGYGEISAGASWMACVDVAVPAGYAGDRYIPWVLDGDGAGTENGSIQVEACTPLRLTPARLSIEGCNGMPQTLEFELENYSTGSVEVSLTYGASRAEFTGPDLPYLLQPGAVMTFSTQLAPQLCLEPGETIVARLTAQGGGYEDTSVVTQTITENAGWRRIDDSPIPAMDNAVIWASHEDGGLWSVGGYGSGGAAQRRDPAAGSWITYSNPLTPVIEYPMDGCYGLNSEGDEIIVLFPDTIVTGTLQIWDITDESWYTEPVPAPAYPAEGRWGQDIVSMLQHTGQNVCYLSGGSTEEGGGRTRDLWRYHPATNTAEYVGAYGASIWFGFHASWYVPWIGIDGAICVAGGVDHNHQISNSTQCYDIAANAFRGLNADLGTLPEPWWGMADGWQITPEHHELWIAGGVAQDGTLLPASAYIREGMSNFAYGPAIPEGLYRLEGDGWEGEFYTFNGARGGFSYSPIGLHLASCPTCYPSYLPLTLRSYL
jgi:hypothetical protein